MTKFLWTVFLSIFAVQGMESDPEQKKEEPKFIILVHRTKPELVQPILEKGLKPKDTLFPDKKNITNDEFLNRIGSRIYFSIASEGRIFDENCVCMNILPENIAVFNQGFDGLKEKELQKKNPHVDPAILKRNFYEGSKRSYEEYLKIMADQKGKDLAGYQLYQGEVCFQVDQIDPQYLFSIKDYGTFHLKEGNTNLYTITP